MTQLPTPTGVTLLVDGALPEGLAAFDDLLIEPSLSFLADLERRFRDERAAALERRQIRQAELDSGSLPGFLPETRAVREGDWRAAPPPPELIDRRVEITGPTDRRMAINALNSGARVWMADFEDANTPSFENLLRGQLNLQDAIDRRITYDSPDGRAYRLGPSPAQIVVRPRGWHLPEKHVLVDDVPMSGALFDFGLYVFLCATRPRSARPRPCFYLPKIEDYREARLWNDAFIFAEDRFGLERGEIRATVLIETILAAFQMDEILYELRDHSAGLNAGRWDYLFSLIKKLHSHGAAYVLPDRNSVTMSAPFMRAYTELLVSTCHRRGVQAVGGMAAFIPSRRDPDLNAVALARVRADKEAEAAAGFDGSWVAHPDLVDTCTEVFSAAFGDRLNQLDRLRDDVQVKAEDLLHLVVPGAACTEAGLRNDISVALQYLAAWIRGSGAVAIFNLMEDVATAEIARSQVWQWLHGAIQLDGGTKVDDQLVRAILEEEYEKIRSERGTEFDDDAFRTARRLFEALVFTEQFTEFLTLSAYGEID